MIGYNVQYETEEGERGQMQVDAKPGESIALGERQAVVGYNVTHRYDNVERTVRMDADPGDRLPVVDGTVVIATDHSAREIPASR